MHCALFDLVPDAHPASRPSSVWSIPTRTALLLALPDHPNFARHLPARHNEVQHLVFAIAHELPALPQEPPALADSTQAACSHERVITGGRRRELVDAGRGLQRPRNEAQQRRALHAQVGQAGCARTGPGRT